MSWGRRRNDYWGGWPRYVPVAERKEKARKQAEKLRKKGDSLSPVVIAGRTIAATFWGKAWCQNLEQYGDYENRIPRGRAYVRNGSVIDLKIGTARVDALVSGTHLYSVAIEIRPLKSQVWNGTKRACTGRIGSLLELLQGKLSREVMEIVTQPADRALPGARRDLLSLLLPGLGLHVQARRRRSLRHRRPSRPGTGAAFSSARRGPSGADRRARCGGSGGLARDGGQDDRRGGSRRDLRHRDRRGAGGSAGHADCVETGQERRNPYRINGSRCAKTGSRSQTGGGSAPPEPLKRKRGRTRLTPEDEVLPKPRRGRPPLVRKEISLPQRERNLSVASEKPAPSRKQSRSHMPVTPTVTPEPARPRRGRMPKAAAPAATPESPKRKRGRPRLTPKTGSADQAAPLPEEPKRERPKLRPAFLKALREEAAARKRREAKEAISPRKKTVSGRGSAGKDTAYDPAPATLPTRKRGRPPGKRKA